MMLYFIYFFKLLKKFVFFTFFFFYLLFFIIQNINSGSVLCEGIFQKKIVKHLLQPLGHSIISVDDKETGKPSTASYCKRNVVGCRARKKQKQTCYCSFEFTLRIKKNVLEQQSYVVICW